MKTGFVLLPGAGMSGWLWQKLMPELSLPAIVIAPRLSPNTKGNRLNARFSEIVAYHQEVIQKSGFDQVIIVGHSGAGLLAGALGKLLPNTKHLVFIAANIPRDGTTAIQVLPEEFQKKNIETVSQQANFDTIPIKSLEAMFVNYFCNTCSPEDIAYVLAQDYYPEPVCVLTEPMDWQNYPAIGKSYILCSQDKTLNEQQQLYMAANLDISDVQRIDSDHLPMISRPRELAKILNGILT